MDLQDIVSDLAAEHDALDAVVRDLPADRWATPTASPGWTVADQIGHLTYFDGTATLAITDPDGFAASLDALLAAVSTASGLDDHTLSVYRKMTPDELLTAWRDGRRALLEAARGMDPTRRVPWYGPSMSAASFLTARLMETWAHGQDVVDALGAHRPPSNRLAHIARLGVITRGWTYANRGEEAPDVTIRVELDGPDGARHIWGPDDADEVVRGPVEDFCLVVIQRRHLDDTDLVIETSEGTPAPPDSAARDWLLKAQAFAGPPTDGPPPGRVPGAPRHSAEPAP